MMIRAFIFFTVILQTLCVSAQQPLLGRDFAFESMILPNHAFMKVDLLTDEFISGCRFHCDLRSQWIDEYSVLQLQCPKQKSVHDKNQGSYRISLYGIVFSGDGYDRCMDDAQEANRIFEEASAFKHKTIRVHLQTHDIDKAFMVQDL